MKIERLKKTDLAEVAEIHMACFNESPYFTNLNKEEALENIKLKLIHSDSKNCLVVKENKKIVGYLITRTMPVSKVIVFGPLGVRKKYRSKHLGLVLTLSALFNLEKKGQTLIIKVDKRAASYLLPYYRRIGFEPVKENEKHYFLKYFPYRVFKKNNIMWRKEPQGGVLRRKGKYYRIDEDTRKLLMTKLINVPPKLLGIPLEAEKDLIDFLKTGKEKGKPHKMPELRYPLKMRLEITGKCNNRCKWCYANQRYAQTELSINDFKKIIKKLAHNGVFKITFSGGEPTLNPELPSLVEYATSYDLVTHLISNGTFLTKDLVTKLEKAGLKSVQISIEGFEKTHNDTTQNNSFNQCVSGIKNCLESKISVATNTTLSRLNYSEITDFLIFLDKLGVPRATLNKVVSDDPNISLSFDEIESVLKKVSKLNLKLKLGWLGVIGKCDLDISKYFNAPRCSACSTSIAISPNGEIRPCSFSNVSLGNIQTNSLKKIWSSEYCTKFRNHEILPEKCKTCKEKKICPGTCVLDLLEQYANQSESSLSIPSSGS